ncbi:uncharacterized protein FIBRA_06098 [Fibroporia radiculosa]|uniref:Uncharacterized protein n=1 Tax=Fibroporia radiculosa TaxID=599839 RepID=J4GS67_9APHY|nr:uncharacterized protein FIBRA_06098 [Fibroporia radiculosa]CCM03945.1 predicted protein [Fibroporia radiculosa]
MASTPGAECQRKHRFDRILSPYTRRPQPSPFTKRYTAFPSPTLGNEMDTPCTSYNNLNKKGGSIENQRLSRSRSSHRSQGITSADNGLYGQVEVGEASERRSSGLGLIMGPVRYPLIPATTTYSERLRRLAPPPLKLMSLLADPLSSSTPRLLASPEPSIISPNLHQVACPLPTGHLLRPTVATPLSPSDDPDSTSLSSFELLHWRRRLGRATEPPLPPLSSCLPGLKFSPVRPALSLLQERGSSRDSVSPRSEYTRFEEPPAYTRSINTPVSSAADAPPLPRLPCMSLPQVMHDDESSAQSTPPLSPLGITFRDALTIDSLVVRADKCLAAAGDAALSLCSCSLLKDPEAIFGVCRGVQEELCHIRGELDATPEDSDAQDTDEFQRWFHSHWQILSSLERNLNIFFLFTDQICRNPPRIHRLAGHVDKMHAFLAKFSDLARRLAISHEKLRQLRVHTQLVAERHAALLQAEAERMRRGEFRAARQEGRVRRKMMRDEIRHSKNITRELRLTRRGRDGDGPDANRHSIKH